jgi:hypothetical protein
MSINSTKSIYFGGCSISQGHGFNLIKQDPEIYANIVGKYYSARVLNDAEGGSSNLKIFIKAAKALIEDRADIFVIQWTAPHRHWLYPRPDQGIFFGASVVQDPYKKFIEQYQSLNNDYYNLISIIDYSRILNYMALKTDKIIVFVNGMLNWSRDWETPYMMSLLEDLPLEIKDSYEQNFNNNLGLLEERQWVQLWDCIVGMKLDQAPLDDHPGPATHEKIASQIINTIDTLRNHT